MTSRGGTRRLTPQPVIPRALNSRGVTLVEALVAGAVTAVLAGGTWGIISLYSGTLSDATANTALQIQADIVREQLSRDIRAASVVLNAGEAPGGSPSDPDTTFHIVLYSDPSVPDTLARDSIAPGLLLEADTTAPFQAFLIGADTVRTDTSGSHFVLDSTRKAVTFSILLWDSLAGKRYTMRTKGIARCRN